LPTKVADLLRIGHLNLLDRLRVLGEALILGECDSMINLSAIWIVPESPWRAAVRFALRFCDDLSRK
jgi:hypothetical protein